MSDHIHDYGCPMPDGPPRHKEVTEVVNDGSPEAWRKMAEKLIWCVSENEATIDRLRHDLQAAMDKIAVMAQHLGRLAEKGVDVEGAA